jgi:late competence protein required for DNA uptake (superfamily II DNA/RNA helicase)
MPIEHVSRTVVIDDLALQIEVDRYICDRCNSRDTFHDIPMPDGHSVFDASRKGWQIGIVHDEEVYCPSCVALAASRAADRSGK